MNNLQTQSDFAISKFESSLSGGVCLQEEQFNFTHWDDIINKILDVWYNKYENHMRLCNSDSDFSDLMSKFKSECVKIFSKKSDFASYRSYYNYIIEFQVKQIHTEINKFDFDQKENNDMMIDKLRNLKLSRQPQVRLVKEEQTNNRCNINMSPHSPFMFNLAHMLRCHSKQNDPNDNSSQVSDAAFEITRLAETFEGQHQYSQVVATCGQSSINLIHVETGKCMQRFNDDLYLNHSKEVYSRLAWTILNGSSVLAAAGKHGQIKLIIPKYSVCLARIDAHKTEVTFLLFHPKYPNILLSASSDHQIKIWKLNLVESNSCTECELTFDKQGIIEYNGESSNKNERVNSMCFVSNSDLIISTELQNYGVHLNSEKLFGDFEQEEETSEDIVNYLTTQPKEKNKIFTAHKLKIISYTENNAPFEDPFVANKIFYFNNRLVACLANSTQIYVSDLDVESRDGFKCYVKSYIKLADYKNEINLMPNFYQNNETSRYVLLRPTSHGLFESVVFNLETSNLFTALRYHIPAEYTIKNQKDLTKIPIKDYNLLEKAKVMTAVSNGEYIVATTNQNLISIWNRIKI